MRVRGYEGMRVGELLGYEGMRARLSCMMVKVCSYVQGHFVPRPTIC